MIEGIFNLMGMLACAFFVIALLIMAIQLALIVIVLLYKLLKRLVA
jgi:hypothetical protein